MTRKIHAYHIETNCSLNFFTTAQDSKTALLRLLTESLDYRNIIDPKKDLIITVKKVK